MLLGAAPMQEQVRAAAWRPTQQAHVHTQGEPHAQQIRARGQQGRTRGLGPLKRPSEGKEDGDLTASRAPRRSNSQNFRNFTGNIGAINKSGELDKVQARG